MHGWITDRSPTEDDTHWTSGECVEVTYKNGLIGWELVTTMRDWANLKRTQIVAWRKIRPAFEVKGEK